MCCNLNSNLLFYFGGGDLLFWNKAFNLLPIFFQNEGFQIFCGFTCSWCWKALEYMHHRYFWNHAFNCNDSQFYDSEPNISCSFLFSPVKIPHFLIFLLSAYFSWILIFNFKAEIKLVFPMSRVGEIPKHNFCVSKLYFLPNFSSMFFDVWLL